MTLLELQASEQPDLESPSYFQNCLAPAQEMLGCSRKAGAPLIPERLHDILFFEARHCWLCRGDLHVPMQECCTWRALIRYFMSSCRSAAHYAMLEHYEANTVNLPASSAAISAMGKPAVPCGREDIAGGLDGSMASAGLLTSTNKQVNQDLLCRCKGDSCCQSCYHNQLQAS